MRAMARRVLTPLLTLCLSLVLGVTMAIAASVEIKMKEGVGNYLTDEKGMTLYMFKNDSAGTSACSGPCVEKWPIFHVDKVVAPLGVSKDDFGVISREDGKMQTTYKGMPLYYYFKDKAAGDLEGQGANNVWYVVAP